MPTVDAATDVAAAAAERPPAAAAGAAEAPTMSGPIVGIIYPPPEVRSILNLQN